MDEIFKFRCTEGDRRLIERLAMRLDRKPSDAVRFVIRQAARQLDAPPLPQPQPAPAEGVENHA